MTSSDQNRRRKAIWLIVLLGILSGIFLSVKMPFHSDAEAYHLINESDQKKLKETTEIFGEGEPQSMIILSCHTKWESVEKFKTLTILTDSIRQWNPNISINGISTIELFYKSGFGIQKKKIKPRSGEQKANHSDIFSKFISDNGVYTIIYFQKDKIPDETCIKLRSIQGTVYDSVFFFDSTTFNVELKSNAIANLFLTGILSLVLIALVFYLLTRSLNGLWLILVMTIFNISVVLVVMILCQIPIGPHISAVPSIIAVMSFSDIMHIIYHYKNAADISEERDRIKYVKKQLSIPMLLTSLTNIIGFLIYLFLSSNMYITQLGFISLVGVAIAYISARFFVIHLVNKKSGNSNDCIQLKIQGFYNRIFDFCLRKKQLVLTSFVGITFLLGCGVWFNLKIDSASRQFIRSGSNTSRAQEILENHFFGNQSLTIIIKNESTEGFFNTEMAHLIEAVEEDIISITKPNYITSPVTVIKRYNRFRVGGHPKSYKTPKTIQPKMESEFNRMAGQLGWAEVISADQHTARIRLGFWSNNLMERIGFYNEIKQKLSLNQKNRITFQLSGESYFQDLGESQFVKLVLSGFLIVLILAGILMSVVLRSLKRTFIFILVNAFPLLFALLLMSIFGIPLNTVSVFLLAILVGLCVDDSIYLIAAPANKVQAVGIYPIIVTSLVLSVGVLSLTFSSYVWLRPFALIFSGSFIAALLADIFILPLLLTKKN